MGKPTPGVLSNKLSMHENNIGKKLGFTCDEENHLCQAVVEHLALVDKTTPKAVQKAVEKGKLAMRSASMISQLPEKEQVAIAEESMKREDGIGRTEIKEIISKPKAEPLKLERTADEVGDDILSSMTEVEHYISELLKHPVKEELGESKMEGLMTTSALLVTKHIARLVQYLNKRGAKPDVRIMALIKANGKY